MLSRLRSLLVRDNGQHGETRVRQEEAGPRSHWKTWRNKWSWGRHRTAREAPSQLSTFTQQEQEVKEAEDLTIQLQSLKYEQLQLMNSLEMREKEHKQVMLDLQKWPIQISDALNKCKRLRKENKTYSYLHSQIVRELPELKDNVHALRAEKIKLWEEQIALQESCEEMKRLLKEVHEKIRDPGVEKQQDQEHLDERLKNLLKQEMAPQQRDLAEKLQHQTSVPEMRSENLQCELEQVTAQDESLLQTELPQQV